MNLSGWQIGSPIPQQLDLALFPGSSLVLIAQFGYFSHLLTSVSLPRQGSLTTSVPSQGAYQALTCDNGSLLRSMDLLAGSAALWNEHMNRQISASDCLRLISDPSACVRQQRHYHVLIVSTVDGLQARQHSLAGLPGGQRHRHSSARWTPWDSTQDYKINSPSKARHCPNGNPMQDTVAGFTGATTWNPILTPCVQCRGRLTRHSPSVSPCQRCLHGHEIRHWLRRATTTDRFDISQPPSQTRPAYCARKRCVIYSAHPQADVWADPNGLELVCYVDASFNASQADGTAITASLSSSQTAAPALCAHAQTHHHQTEIVGDQR
jgi:hypothetical protein